MTSSGEASSLPSKHGGVNVVSGLSEKPGSTNPQSRRRSCKIAALYICVAAFSIVIISSIALLCLLHPAGNTSNPYLSVNYGDDWSSWRDIQQLIVFGDSWSSTGYDPNGTRPSANDPLGNPYYPGWTGTNGANWIDHITETYNQSLILTTNYAVGGSTIDPDGDVTQRYHMNRQVLVDFGHDNGTWTANSSLFVLWIGVNDIASTPVNRTDKFVLEFDIFADLLGFLFDAGARNFMILNAAPLQRSPHGLAQPPGALWPTLVAPWNTNITNLVTNFSEAHQEATTFLFDAYLFFGDVMDNPCILPQSCGFKTTNTSCDPYYYGTPEWNTHDPACPYSVDQYLWLNGIHPSTQMHNALAYAVADALEKA